MSKLVVFRGDAVQHEIHLTGDTVSIGRDPRNDIVLDDPSKNLSRFHAEVRFEGGAYFIVDLKSRNGVWMNARRVHEKAELALGAPVTLGAYELVLEDDVSSGEFGIPPAAPQQTEVKAAPGRPVRQTRPRTREWSIPPFVTANRQMLLWSGLAVVVLLISAVTYAVVRSRTPRTTAVVASDLPVAPPAPPPPAGPPDIQDPRRDALKDRLAAARREMEDQDYRGALRNHVLPVLELIAQLGVAGDTTDFEPENQQALQLKKEAEGGAPRPPDTKPTPTVAATDTTNPIEGLVPGIVPRPNETQTDYTARAGRITGNFREGSRYLEAQDFANALARFRLVEADQKGYRGVDATIAETAEKQRRAVATAMSTAQQAEQAGNLGRARQWYQSALATDPDALAARDRNNFLLNKMNEEANKLFNTASFNRKAGNTEAAKNGFQQIVALMLPGDEFRIRAEKELEALKK